MHNLCYRDKKHFICVAQWHVSPVADDQMPMSVRLWGLEWRNRSPPVVVAAVGQLAVILAVLLLVGWESKIEKS